MLKIFGKNNNQLFKLSQKATYSMPQSLNFNEKILKCACGFDYIAIITEKGQLYFLFQSKLYIAQNVPLLADVCTSQNTLTMLTKDDQLLVWDFDEQKVINNMINFTKIRLTLDKSDCIKKLQMGCNDIFLISDFGKIYHFKRNQWYQTKSYSNIESVQLSHRIVDVSTGPQINLFLSYQGTLFASSRNDPLHLTCLQFDQKFIKIAAYNYNVGITKKGELMIWGDSIHGKFRQPTQFTKLTKKFIDVKLDKQNGYALADDGQVWVWGMNSNGQLGLSDYQIRAKPFPLITLQKKFILDIFCGPSYACCLCQFQDKQNKNSIQVINKKCYQFSALKQQKIINKKKQQRNDPIYIEQQDYQIKYGDIIPSQIRIKTRKQDGQSKGKQNTASKSHKRKSSSPIPKHKKSGSQLSEKNRKEKKQNFNKRVVLNQVVEKNSYKNNQQVYNKYHQKTTNVTTQNTWTINETDHQFQSTHRSNQDENKYQVLKFENESLKQKITQQEQLISDITKKIRLLQEAIEQHERNLTQRDNIVHQYKNKQKQYISHIQELQKTIDQIVRFRQKNNQIMIVYEDLKVNFQKQRQYYVDKIKQCQVKIHQQQKKHKKQIQQLTKKYSQIRQGEEHLPVTNPIAKTSVTNPLSNISVNNLGRQKQNKLNWQSHSPIVKKQQIPYFKGEFQNEKLINSEVDHAIDQIQINRSRITKSANKLIAMLDISQ